MANKSNLPDEWFFDPSDPKQAPKLKEFEGLNQGFEMLQDVLRVLAEEDHPQAKKLAFAMGFLTIKDRSLKLRAKADKAKAGSAVTKQKTKASKTAIRDAKIYAASVTMDKKSGWSIKLGKMFDLTPKRIENIVSEIKNKSK